MGGERQRLVAHDLRAWLALRLRQLAGWAEALARVEQDDTHRQTAQALREIAQHYEPQKPPDVRGN